MSDTPETIMRGSKIRIYPNKLQAQRMDLWRRRTISLWNLLLSFEQAAYSGENIRPELRWRQKLVEIAAENYQRDMHVWNHGRGGKRARKPGHILLQDYARAKAVYDSDLLAWKQSVKAWKAAGQLEEKPKKPTEPKEPQPPQPPSDMWIAKILNGRDGTLYFNETDELDAPLDKAYQPRLFIWKRQLMALMARLKQEPRTKWIGDLPSHAAQRVCADLEQAINTMLSERKKAAGGMPSRKTGFPKVKRSGFANGSVYFAYTQIRFDFDEPRYKRPILRFPAIGDVALHTDNCSPLYSPKEFGQGAQRVKKGKLMGGRIFRVGDQWWISSQWEIPKPTPLLVTGRTAGVKIAAAVILTTYDGRTSRQVDLPPVNRILELRHKKAQQQMARSRRGQKLKEAKLAARGKNVRSGKPIRLKPSKTYLEAAAERAKVEALDRARHNGLLHRETTKIVQQFDEITVQKMDVASMVRRRKRIARHERRQEEGGAKRRRDVKQIRKIMRRAAMGRIHQLLTYKAADYGRIQHHTDPLKPIVQRCNQCGHLNPQMKDGRLYLRCESCGYLEERRRNAAKNEHASGHKSKTAAGT